MFKGCFTALITPFRNGKVDDGTFQSFVDWQINEGKEIADAPMTTVGEALETSLASLASSIEGTFLHHSATRCICFLRLLRFVAL